MFARFQEQGGLIPAAWLVVDAALAALLAGPAEVLLLYVLTPGRPLTLGDALATLLAILPQVVLIFVLLGPAAVLASMALSVGRTTRRGISVGYVLRFALLDAILLSLAALVQWKTIGPLLPGRGQVSLALMVSTMVLVAIALAVLSLRDLLKPGASLGPWLLAVGVGMVVALAAAAELRRVHYEPPQVIALPGLKMARPLVLLEVPALAMKEFQDLADRGVVPVFDTLRRRGTLMPVQGEDLSDSLALHASLITGQGPARHGLLGSVRYQPLGDRRSFAVMPRGLLLRPLLRTLLWGRIPVDHEAVRSVSLSRIAESMAIDVALISDPLGWPAPTESSWSIPLSDLSAGERIDLPGESEPLVCEDPGNTVELFFDPIASDLPESVRLAKLLRDALIQDLCALEAGHRAVAQNRFGIVHLRLSGYYDVAYQFAGWKPGQAARGASAIEITAWGKTLVRYAASLAEPLERVIQEIPPDALVVLVSSHGIRPRKDLRRIEELLIGQTGPTGTHAGPPPGVLLFAGEGLRRSESVGQALPLKSVLPTILWLCGLPVAEDMGPIDASMLDPASPREAPMSLPSYASLSPG